MYIISRTEGHRSTCHFFPSFLLFVTNINIFEIVNVAFSGYGPCDLPETFDDIIPWFHKFETTHSKVPEWVYKFINQLLDLREHAKISTIKNCEHRSKFVFDQGLL